MIVALYTWRFWVVLLVAIGVVAAYFGLLASVNARLEELAASGPIVRLANQPGVKDTFKDPSGGRMDAYVVMFLFVFLSPLAIFMAVVLAIFLLSALSIAVAPVLGGERIALLVLEIVAGFLVYWKQEAWLPHVSYYLGLLARAYVVITS
jgi:hypothetical protein